MEQVRLVLTVISTFGLGSVLVIIIGRLWTISYFRHFGLSTADLEFSIDDFAFRSLEVLISLGLGGLGLLVAWHARAVFKVTGLRSWLLEIVVVGGAVSFVYWGLGPCVDRAAWLVKPGVLGVISGAALFVMIMLVADVWFGPERSQETSQDGEKAGLLRRIIGQLQAFCLRLCLRSMRNNPEARGDGQKPGLPKPFLKRLAEIAVIGWLITNRRKLAAGGMMVSVVFIYLPLITGRLARIEAESDLKEGHLPVAILESFEAPLPGAIASDADPKKSGAVRVILAQRQNTYVLDSTRCKAIGELKVEETEEGTFVRDPNVCKVFAIPTSRLKSIEYRMVTGTPPSNDTSFTAQAVDPREPLDVTVCTTGASDDEGIHCQEGREAVSFYNTIWYKVSPALAGTLLVRATSLEGDLEPIVGVWEGSEEGVVQPEVAPGSGPGGRACEASSDGDMVGTVANLEANKTYFVVIGAQDDQEGDFGVHIEFTADGLFYGPDIEIAEETRPEVQVECVDDRVELELRELDETTYEWKALAAEPEGFSLIREQPDEDAKEDSIPLVLVGELKADEDRTLLIPDEDLDPGTWTLREPDDFIGHARLVVTRTLQRDLVLAFADTSTPPLNDIRTQAALLLVIDPGEIREKLLPEGLVIFDPNSHDPEALTFDPGEDSVHTARELLAQAGITREELKDLRVQIHVYPATEEEGEALDAAAAMVRNQLLALGLTATVDQQPCEGICICVFFRTRAYSISTATTGEAAEVGSTS